MLTDFNSNESGTSNHENNKLKKKAEKKGKGKKLSEDFLDSDKSAKDDLSTKKEKIQW